MKCTRFVRKLWCTVLSGAVATLGPVGTHWLAATEMDPAPPAAVESVEDFGLPAGHCCPMEEVGSNWSDEDYASRYSWENETWYEDGSSDTAEAADLEDSLEATGDEADDASADAAAVEDEESCEDDYGCYEYDEEALASESDSYDEYGYEEMSGEETETADEAAEAEDNAVGAVEESGDDSGDMYEDEYMYDFEDAYGDEGQPSETQEISDEQPADESATSSSGDCSYDSYDYADYESMYGYGYDCGAPMEQVETVEEAQPVDEAAVAEEAPVAEENAEAVEAAAVEEPAVAEEPAMTEETADDEEAWDYGDEYEYGNEYDYGMVEDEMEPSADDAGQFEAADETAVEEEGREYQYDDEMMAEPSGTDETVEPADEAAEAEVETEAGEIGEAASVESQPYNCEDWADQYGEYYGCEYADEPAAPAPAEAAAPEVAECGEYDYGMDEYSAYESAEPAQPYGSSGEVMSDYDEFGYETSYSESGDETAAEDAAADEPVADESAADESAADESEPMVRYESWNGYQYEYYYPESGDEMSETGEAVESEEEAVSEPAESNEPASDDVGRYDYADPYEYYGYDFPGEAEQPMQAENAQEPAPPAAAGDSGLELFGWTPAELLSWSDQELLRTLGTLQEESSDVRRAALNDYLYSLGTEAQEFAAQFEETTGIEVLGLSDDLPGAAALLATFRLVERGELGASEGVDLLRRSLQDLAPQWIDGVRVITDGDFEDWDGSAQTSPVIDAMISLAVNSLSGVGGTVLDLSQALVALDWANLVQGCSDRAASHTGMESECFQR